MTTAAPTYFGRMHHTRRGRGQPLLLIHGLGGNVRSFSPIEDGLAASREVIAVDLPGFGATPALPGEVSIRTLADAVTRFLDDEGLRGVDAVGTSMGARLVLELARRGGVLGSVVSLAPGGFWQGWERHVFYASIALSVRLVRALQPVLDGMTASAVGRTLLLPQFSPRPWRLPPAAVLEELRSYAEARSFDALLWSLAYGEAQQGAPKGSIARPLAIGWGRRDRVCLPRQAARACALFPDARLHWFDRCGHFPHWDRPDETVQLILETIGERPRVLACEPAGPAAAAAVPAAAPALRRTAQREPLTQRG